jgi:MFS family permease
MTEQAGATRRAGEEPGSADRGSTGLDDGGTNLPPVAVDSPTADRDFGKLWAGQSISLVGDQFMVLTLPLLAVGVLHASASQAALLSMAMFLPFLLFGLPAGAVIERLRRRTVLMLCDLVQFAAFGMIAVLAPSGVFQLWMLLALVFVAGTATVFFQVAYTSYLPALFVNDRKLHRANSRLFLSESLSHTIGPVVAGPTVVFLGAVWAVGLNSLTFLISIVAVVLIRTREPVPELAGQRERGWIVRDVKAGLKFVFQHKQLEPVILCGTVYVLFLTVVESSLVLYCGQVLGLGPVGIGLVIGAAATGFPIGNLFSGKVIDRFGVPRTLVLGACVSVTGLIIMPIAGSFGSIAGLIAGSIVHGIGEGTFGPTSLTLRQTASPAHLLGRVQSIQRFLIWGITPVGSLIASVVIAGSGLSAAVWVGGVGTVLCIPILLRRGIRSAFAAPPNTAVDATASETHGR